MISKPSLVVSLFSGLFFYVTSVQAQLDTVVDYLEEAAAYKDENPVRSITLTSSDQYVVIGYTLHAGQRRNWMCSVNCTSFDGDRCREGTGPGNWRTLDAAKPLLVNGRGGDDTLVGAPHPDFHPGEPCKSDEGGAAAGTWDPPTIPYLELYGSSGDDVIVGPPGNIYTLLAGGFGNDYVETRSTNSRSIAYGGDYYCLGETCFDTGCGGSGCPDNDGNDSLFGFGMNYSATSMNYSGDNLFGGYGNDCLSDNSSGATNFECNSGSDEYVAPAAGTSRVSCETIVSSCWSPF